MDCRHCHAPLSHPFVDLGSAPPSNAYLTAAALQAPETWYPLKLLTCDTCWLVQTEDHAGRDALFTQDYAYFSSFSTSWLEHARRYVDDMVERFGLGETSQIVEIAANDGYLLQYVKAAGIPCYGIEPTASTAAAAREKGIEIDDRFFGVALAQELATAGRQADLTAANNVLAHVPDINDFVKGFAILLKPQGVATFEFPHLLQMVECNEFDTAYHEHYSYLSLTACDAIFRTNGMVIFDVEELPTHGGSLRLFAQRADAGRPVEQRVVDLLEREATAGMKTLNFYSRFQVATDKVKDDLLAFLVDSKRAGLRVAAYGAAAKGNTLLNYAGVRPDLIEFVVDLNPAKAGKFMPGSRIPIVGEDVLRARRPDRIVILPWNLRSEIAAQLAYTKDWNARLAVAVPELELL